jgi:hypothetical protein
MKDKITNQVRIQLVHWVNPAWLKLLVTIAMLGSAGMAQAAARVAQTSADLPFYARIAQGEIYHDGEWAAIAFYRPPGCIREDFNLLDFLDIPEVFGCNSAEPYVIGFAVLKNDVPIQSRLQLNPNLQRLKPKDQMPIWFVSWTELQTAIEDDFLTIQELFDMDSLLIGTAKSYTETLHPFGFAQQTMISIVASGILEDGRKFSYQATGTKEDNRLNHVKIEFK